jgi:hypothetical protein
VSDHLDPMTIEPERLARWKEVALLLGPSGETVALELTDFALDPVRHRLRRAGAAARYAAGVAQTARAREIAGALATEIEVAAEQ